MASRSGVRAPERYHGMIRNAQSGLRRWREVKRRPVQGNSPNDRILHGPDCNRHKRVYADSFPATPLPRIPESNRFPECVWGGMRNLSVRWDGQTIPKRVRRTASRWSAPRFGWGSTENSRCGSVAGSFHLPSDSKSEGPRNAFFQAWRNLSVRCVITSDKPGAGVPLHGRVRARLSDAPEEHALPNVHARFRPALP